MTKLDELREFFSVEDATYWSPALVPTAQNKLMECTEEVNALLAEAEKQYTRYCRVRDLYHQAENACEIAEKRWAELETKLARVAELEAENAKLKGLNAQNDEVYVRQSRQRDTRIAELEAENVRLRGKP